MKLFLEHLLYALCPGMGEEDGSLLIGEEVELETMTECGVLGYEKVGAVVVRPTGVARDTGR
ncbi:MAG: hypothetical protein IKS36_01470 [Bacteroidales bacterium]|nr:hypothetical protein [Bacteroidales bacterium]